MSIITLPSTFSSYNILWNTL